MSTSKMNMTSEVFSFLLGVGCIDKAIFLIFLPFIRQEIGAINYGELLELSLAALTPQEAADHTTGYNTGLAAYRNGDAIETIPYDFGTQPYQTGGWYRGWYRGLWEAEIS